VSDSDCPPLGAKRYQGVNRGVIEIDAIDASVGDGPMHRVVIVAFVGVQSLDVSGPAEVFAGVNTYLRESGGDLGLGYDVSIVSLGGDNVSTETLRRTLHRHRDVSPEAYRQRFSYRLESTPT
jgi:hypothetical protein